MVFPEAAVLRQPAGILPGRNRARTGTDRLEIRIRNPSGRFRETQHRRAHAVAARHILGAAFQHETGILGQLLAQGDGIVIVTAMRHGQQLDAAVEPAVEPQIVETVFRDADYDWDPVVRADLGEGPGRIAGRLDNQRPFLVRGKTRQHRIGLRLLERAGAHLGTDGRIPAREGNVEVLQAQMPGQALRAVGHRGRGAAQRAPDGHPVGITVDAGKPLPGRKLFLVIDGPHERRRTAFRIRQGPSFVLEFTAVGHIHEMIRGRRKSHIRGCFVFHGYRSRPPRRYPAPAGRHNGRRSTGTADRP